MQTNEVTCDYYDPCGGPECKACNDTLLRGVLSREREDLESEAVLIRLSNSVVPELNQRTSERASGAFSCVASPAGTWPVFGQARGPDQSAEHRRVFGLDGLLSIASDNNDELSEKETSDAPPFRYVKETKRKRRLNARERKEIRSSKPPSGVQLVADNFDNNYAKEALNRSDNKFSCLEDDEGEEKCRFSGRLMGKAKALVSFLSDDLGIQADATLLPHEIVCGRLRSAVRGCFPSALSCVEELSIKTVQKVEKSCCAVCRPTFDRKLDEWKEALEKPVTIDGSHLERFRHAIRSNIRKGWNSMPGPYIPNGSATFFNTVKDGGNWHEEPFSDLCRATLVFSSGKPRVVTCYSSYNSRVLSPLHNSLYECLRRKGWLLVGQPTTSQVTGLNGDGPFLSFDYVGATDNIKSEYTRAAIEVLIDQAEGLSADEVRCLRVLGNLKVVWNSIQEIKNNPVHELDIVEDLPRGQPMGSLMSFPLLCLINKTVVDLALTDLLSDRVISFNEWTQHRCLINGDDLLVKEPKRNSNLKDAIARNGSAVGLIVNEEKSGVSALHAEINSTPFTNFGAEKQVKTNAKSLYMSPDTEDVLGFAYESCRSVRSFIRVVRANRKLLAKQEDKMIWRLPYPYQAAIRKDKKIRKAVALAPLSRKETIGNLFPIVDRPVDYSLTREEEVRVLNDEVQRVRSAAIELQKAKAVMKTCRKRKIDGCYGPFSFTASGPVVLAPHGRSWRSLLRKKKGTQDTILRCLESAFREKQMNSLVEADGWLPSYLDEGDFFHDESIYPNKVSYLIDAIGSYVRQEKPKPRFDIPPVEPIVIESKVTRLHQFSFSEIDRRKEMLR